MRFRRLACISKIDVTDDVEPAYRWRNSNQNLIGYDYGVCEHRVPFFLSLHAHLVVEEKLEYLGLKFMPKLLCNVWLLFYTVTHGFVCGFSMRESILFWKSSLSDEE